MTAIIPNWNGEAHLPGVLDSLDRQTLRPTRVLVVDNGSTDRSIQVAADYGADVIRLDRNFGFATAVNRGVEDSRTPWVLIANNDLEFDPHWIDTCHQAASGSWFAIGRVLRHSERNIIDGTRDLLARSGCAWRVGAGRPDCKLWHNSTAAQLVPMTAALIKRDLFNRVGLLDERFRSYLEDVEFGLRCASMGYSGTYAADAVSYHKGSSTWGAWSAATVRQISRNQLLLVAKHYSPEVLKRNGWAIAVGQLFWGLLAVRHAQALPWIAGKVEALREWRSFRAEVQPGVGPLLAEMEREILHLQALAGFDWYWRTYARLT